VKRDQRMVKKGGKKNWSCLEKNNGEKQIECDDGKKREKVGWVKKRKVVGG